MEPLDMYRFPSSREFQPEGRAFIRSGADVNLPGMFLNDAVTYRKSQARAATRGFRGEERIEDAVQIFTRNPRTCIGNFDFDGAVIRGSANIHHAPGGHGIASIHKK